MRKDFDARAARMRQRQLEHPGSGGWQTRSKKFSNPRVGQASPSRNQGSNGWESERVKPIHPDILAADCGELMEMGWGSTMRWEVPLDWRTRRGPDAKK